MENQAPSQQEKAGDARGSRLAVVGKGSWGTTLALASRGSFARKDGVCEGATTVALARRLQPGHARAGDNKTGW